MDISKVKGYSGPLFYRSFLVLFFLLSLNLSQNLLAQDAPSRLQNLSGMKVEELSDEQLLNFRDRYLKEGYRIENLRDELLRRNMSATDADKMVERLKKLSEEKPITEELSVELTKEKPTGKPTDQPFLELMPRVFGAELFTNPKLSFEPNLRMATPAGYQLGPDDEIALDIFGFSEQSYKLKVSPEGMVRIPNLGPVQVSGLTIDQASSRIRNQLVALYPRIATGETRIALTLVSIRSIKVHLLGEVNLPGTYTLPSVATVLNALHASGGPNANGSFRTIKIIRGNKVVAVFDLYELLMHGTGKGNITLRDQDVIKVDAYKNRVEMKGFVKREGLFEVVSGDRLKDVLEYAGGFAPNAYTSRIKVVRINGTTKGVADVFKDQYAQFSPLNGDVFYVDTILNRFENRVTIEGAVMRPGFFSLENNRKLSQLLKNADGVREDAFLSRATLIRQKQDRTLEATSVDLKSVIDGTLDMDLRNEDRLVVASKEEMHDPYVVTISGQVQKPGTYKYAQGMQVEDLIILAGGLKEGASLSNVQVAERGTAVDRKDPSASLSAVHEVKIEADLKTSGDGHQLKPYDVVTVLPDPRYSDQKQVLLTGEVMYPGNYVITRGNERVSDLIKRSGGLTSRGFAGGAILIRQKGNSYQQKLMTENKIRLLKKMSKDTTNLREAIEKELGQTNDIVGIDLETILRKPGNKEDLFMREGDILEVPAMRQTVLVSGEVLYPARLRFESHNGLRKYVSRSGGFRTGALRRHTYVVYANGTAHDTRNFLFFKVYPKVKPGCEIVVPLKEDKKSLTPMETVTIATSLTSMLLILSTIIPKIQF